MSLRAFIIGLIGATFLCGYAFYNDIVLHQTGMGGTHFPRSVYGSLIAFLFVINPLMEMHLAKQWSLTLSAAFYYRKTHYSYYDDVKAKTFETRLGITCRL